MALSRLYDGTSKYKQNLYNINLDVSGWDRTTIHVVTPQSGSMGVLSVYGSNDGGATQGVGSPSPSNAQNFTTIQAKNLSTGTLATTINAGGLYQVDANARYLRLAGGADVYKLFFQHTKD